MRWLLVIFLCCIGFSAGAQTVRVTTGDHPGFTRIVLESPGLAGWQLSRLAAGYAINLRRPTDFDLERAFRVISRDRLAGLDPTPDRRGLVLSVACACHAVGYDYRPGIVVIDLRDGPPPYGSSFELGMDGILQPPLSPAQLGLPRQADTSETWDWARHALSGNGEPSLPRVALPQLPDAQETALRASLVKVLADGVARGLVDTVRQLPSAPPPNGSSAVQGRAAFLELPGLAGFPPQSGRPALAEQGATCIDDARVNISEWGNPDTPPAAQLSGVGAFLGEFDRPDPAKLAQAVRRYLWLGFGAEAGLLVDTFGENAADSSLWRSMAKVIDGGIDKDGPFEGMASCDGWAALWSVLSSDTVTPTTTDTAAVLRGFSALPPHLRDQLGPSLAERFLKAGDGSTAQGLRDAMTRGDPDGAPLVDAQLSLHDGDPALAEVEARAALAEGGPAMGAALAALVEARMQARKPVATEDVVALQALVAEQPTDPAITRALILAQALSGSFDRAFAVAAAAPNTVARATWPDLWALLVEVGSDSDLLAHAVDSLPNPLPVAQSTRDLAAKRLTTLGFGDAARVWFGPEGDPVARGRAYLVEDNPAAALAEVTGVSEPGAAEVRAKALLELGEPLEAAYLFASLPDQDGASALSARIRARDWEFLRQSGPEPWQAAVAELKAMPDTAPLPADGPLATSRAALAQSENTRAAVTALLASVPDVSDGP